MNGQTRNGGNGNNALVAFASAGEAARLAEEGRAAVQAFVGRYRSTTMEAATAESWRYPWTAPAAAGEEKAQEGVRIRAPRLLEHRFEVPLTLSVAAGDGVGLGEGGGQEEEEEVRVVLSGVLDRVDALKQEQEQEEGEGKEEEVRAGMGLCAKQATCACSALPSNHHPPRQEELWLVEYKSRVGPKDIRRMARDSLQLGIYSLAVRRLLGRPPSRLVIESIEDGRIGRLRACVRFRGFVWGMVADACFCFQHTTMWFRGGALGGGGGAARAAGHRRGKLD